jgi:hypothetical protein
MASNGDMTRNWFGGIPIIIYDDAVTYLGDMARNLFGGIPQFIGPVIASPSGPANLKTWSGVAKAAIAKINGVAIAGIKTVNGVA